MSYYCAECCDECTPRVSDEGIGNYEFWGAKGTDHNYQLKSDCCDASVTDSSGDFVSAREYENDQEDGRADYDMDCAKDAEFEAKLNKEFGK